MSSNYFFKVKGVKSGQFKGDELVKKGTDGWMQGLAFDYALVSPRDVATGQASGRRQHHPVKVHMDWGPSAPQFFAAAVNNEELTEVNFEFYRPEANGVDTCYYKITLKKAKVASIRFVRDPSSIEGAGASKGFSSATYTRPEMLEMTFIFQEIVMDHVKGATSGQDTWTAQL
jgi:type VI secretion system secreted protein Hcp